VDYTGKQSIELPPGNYTLDVQKSGYVDRSETIELPRGGNIEKTFVLEKNSGVITLSVTPSDARVLINKADYTGKPSIELPPGKYTIEVQNSGYVDISETFELKRSGKIERTFILEKNSGTLNLSVTPSDARVLINKEDYANKNTIELAPGRYKIEIQKSGYIDQSETIDIARGGKINKQFSLVAKTGTLQFSVTPVDAKVQLMRGSIVIYSWEGLKIQKGIPVGEYELISAASGFRTIKKTVMITESKTVIEDIVMQKESIEKSKQQKRTSIADFILVEGGPTGDFYISATEVTFEQYDTFCDATGYTKPSADFGRGKQPVINVNVADAVAYCKWASKETGTTIRLPEEKEWEFAAKGGKKSYGYTYSGSNSVGDIAWFAGNSDNKTHEVATKRANELGIYDMSGNVWEWCGTSGAIRGGSWRYIDLSCRVSNRYDLYPDARDSHDGFRLLQKK
jgi:hypothetical protein